MRNSGRYKDDRGMEAREIGEIDEHNRKPKQQSGHREAIKMEER